jgi:AcrR family transcriptional regulator
MVVAREGYENASVDRIAEEAGFSKGAFYSNFSNKEEIILELLETHSLMDVTEIAELLGDVTDPQAMIEIISNWALARSTDSSWGLLALELFHRARRDATFGERHATLFQAQWQRLGEILLRMFPEGAVPADPEALGGIVFELTYGAAASFKTGPTAGDLVRLALTAMLRAYGEQQGGKHAS